MFKTYEILDIAIQLENNAETLYRSKAREFDRSDLRELMIWMADEEKNHAQWFASLKNRVKISDEEALMREMSEDLLTDFMGKACFSLDDAVFQEIRTKSELVETFIEFEEDTILFYELLQSFITDDDTAKNLKNIIEEEKKHINTFKQKGFL
ncbi:MAG: rubrerythrin [Desulfobacteraceae bacterium]|nr:rubrerythrin [Desulfobacteraceae bacterium]MBU4001602.1 ferritin family protein [Pseudomonadota bacterium]MBU4053340.1 ferritin family protein [Pseudomonadota bacterium]